MLMARVIDNVIVNVEEFKQIFQSTGCQIVDIANFAHISLMFVHVSQLHFLSFGSPRILHNLSTKEWS